MPIEEMQELSLKRYKKGIGLPLREYLQKRAIESKVVIPKEISEIIQQKMERQRIK